MRGWLRLVLRVAAMLLVTLVGILPVYLSWRLGWWRVNAWLVWAYYWIERRVYGISVRVHGQATQQRPALLVSNHVSYLDVIVMGSLMPLAFTPKVEIAGWPVIGFFCRISRCVFIDRRPSRVEAGRAALLAALKKGDQVLLFPEGTTGNGSRILPFRSSFFSLAEDQLVPDLALQAVTIAYTRRHGLPMGFSEQPMAAWYGDMDFAPHFLDFLKGSGFGVDVMFHPPLNCDEIGDRKEMAALMHKVIERSFSDLRSAKKRHP